MTYKVLVVVKDGWYSDHAPCNGFAAARRHQTKLADKWSTSETAIMAPDGRVLNFMESKRFRQELKALR